MIAYAGIDLGGTKAEAQLFDTEWQLVERRRVSTPETYEALVETLVELVRWVQDKAEIAIPIGIGAAGLVDENGNAFTANLPAKGRPLPADIERAVGQKITYVNDCRALALSEAVFGIGQEHKTVVSLILGTGVGGGVAYDTYLRPGPAGVGGEFGHVGASAAVIQAHGVPIYPCGCGRRGCIESYISGPGLVRMARDLCGLETTPQAIGQGKAENPQFAKVWNVWLELTADLLLTLVQTIDPDVIVLGGGLSQIPHVADELSDRLAKIQIEGFRVPPVVLATGGDASGARGAALAAAQEAEGA